MKGFQSCFTELQGNGMTEPAEAAHILASLYSQLSGDFIRSNRNLRSWFLTVGGIGIAVLIISAIRGAITGVVLGLLVAAVGGSVVVVTLNRKPKGRVLAIGKAYWVGSLEDFEGGQLLVDKSQLTQSTSFIVPIPGMRSGDLLAAAAKSHEAVDSPPILVPRARAGAAIDMRAESSSRDPVQVIRENLEEVADGLANYREERASLPVLAANGGLTQAILRDIPHFTDFEPRNQILGVSAEDMKKRLEDLGRLTSIAREKTERTSSVEELAEEVVASLEASVKTLDNTRRVSLIDVLGRLLDRLEKAYRAPMLLYYCPKCLDNAARGIGLNLDKVRGVQIDDDTTLCQLFKESPDMPHLCEAVKRFANTSRAALMKLEITPTGEEVWRCPQDHIHPVNDEGLYVAYRAKQELVLPLWDQLWMELSTARAGLHERKDKEQRDNLRGEHLEVAHAAEQFDAERRDIKSRMESLASSSMRAVETFNELISSFAEVGLLSGQEVTSDLSEARKIRQQYLNMMSEIDKRIEQIEKALGTKREESLHRLGPVMEVVDTVKLGSQFMELNPPTREDIVVENL